MMSVPSPRKTYTILYDWITVTKGRRREGHGEDISLVHNIPSGRDHASGRKNPILENVCLNRNGFDQSDYFQETTRPALTLVPCLVAVLTRRLAARKGVNQRGSNSVQGQWPNFSLSTKSNLAPYTRHRCTLAMLQSRRVLGRWKAEPGIVSDYWTS